MIHTFLGLSLSLPLRETLVARRFTSIQVFFIFTKSNLSLYLLYNSEVCNQFAEAHLRVIAPSLHRFFRNVAAVARRWQHCIRFVRPQILPRTSRSKDEIPLDQVALFDKCFFAITPPYFFNTLVFTTILHLISDSILECVLLESLRFPLKGVK